MRKGGGTVGGAGRCTHLPLLLVDHQWLVADAQLPLRESTPMRGPRQRKDGWGRAARHVHGESAGGCAGDSLAGRYWAAFDLMSTGPICAGQIGQQQGETRLKAPEGGSRWGPAPARATMQQCHQEGPVVLITSVASPLAKPLAEGALAHPVPPSLSETLCFFKPPSKSQLL